MHEEIRLVCNSTEFYIDEGCFITELSNSANDPTLSIARARVLPDVTTRWHRLINITERYVILSGKGRVEVGELLPQTVVSGDAVIIPPGCAQRITNISNEDLIFLVICSPRFLQDAYQDIEADYLK